MMKKESKFKEKVLKDLKAEFGKTCKALKTQERGRRGVPDLILCLTGSYVAIELKNDGEVPEPIQRVFLDCVTGAGGLAFSTTPQRWKQHLSILRRMSMRNA